MKNKRGNIAVIAIIIIIVALTAGVTGWMFAKNSQAPVQNKYVAGPITQTQSAVQSTTSAPADEVVNWQTYKNAKYGFEFKYPANLSVSENGDTVDLYVSSLKKASDELENIHQEPHTGIFPYRMLLECNSSGKFFYNEDSFKKNISTSKMVVDDGGVIIEQTEKSDIGSTSSPIRFYKFFNGDYGFTAVAFLENANVYCYAEPMSQTAEQLTIAEKLFRIEFLKTILSTFKFTK